MITFKIGLIISSIFLVVNADVEDNACPLKYRSENVENKPDLVLTVLFQGGVCRIKSDGNVTKLSRSNEDYRYDQVPTLIASKGLNYDSQTSSIIYTVNELRNRIKINIVQLGLNDQTFKIWMETYHEMKERQPKDLSYDWVSKNLYINDRKNIWATNKNVIEIISARQEITSFAVHPNQGYLFFVDLNISYIDPDTRVVSNAIYRTNLDGTNPTRVTKVLKGNDRFINSLAVDFYEDRLYWALPNERRIQHSKLDGTDVKELAVDDGIYFGVFDDGSRSLAIGKDYIYYLPHSHYSVRRIRKSDNKRDEDFEITLPEGYFITEIALVDPEAQKIRDDHPCKDQNGGCEKFCFVAHTDEGLEKRCK